MSRNKTEEAVNEKTGYGIDELRYRRAYALAKYELAKMQMTQTVDTVRHGIMPTTGRGIMGKILGSLNYLDYAVIAYRIISKLMKIRRRAKR